MFRKFLLFLLSVFSLLSITVRGQETIKISHMPYLQGLTENSVSIVWTSNKPAIAWVELADDDGSHFYKEERAKFFASKDGFKSVGTLHEVKLKNLSPNTTYRYRVYVQEVLQHEGTKVIYGSTAATGVYRQEPLKFKTNGKQEEVNFAVVNDIHGRNNILKSMVKQVDLKTTDFIVFNGDMVDNLLSEEQMFGGFMDTATALFASEIPMYYARGNHETRGPFAFDYSKYFPTSSGKLYYSFTVGDASFIVLDCGEDKPDSDIEYSGIVDMDQYRTDQAEWLKDELQKDTYKNAKYKVIICHMPPFGGWHGEEDIAKKFVPLLNESGAQIMLSGHLHKHMIVKENEVHSFPVIVNSNNNLLKVSLTKSHASFKVVDLEGKLVDEVKLSPLK
ncbi:metallophosphoesterase family protein [Sphingobacterium sp. UT-1RO-CII-1]|uniref:purple acid phosphatase family protein n=1 Tax=Sphingobacterium sp. UT-1RO-CII-1 TaxID=2995225 RepID=UPI00227B21DD|nr:metallophosphoesterase family protein [Sphingobacterium sp. UT-1RO-CII-1]MCY4780745.1 metallophosphoesterase family protein [Sphingobacterium sp. UT-1RO-CII-1]